MINGQRVCQSTGTEDRTLAMNILAKVRTEVIERRYYPKPIGENKLFYELLARFVKEHSRWVSERTRESYANSLKHLLPVFSQTPLNKVTPKRLYQYQQDRLSEGAAPSSVNREVALVSVAFGTAMKKWEWIDTNPCSRVSRLPENNERVRYLTGEEVEMIYSTLPEWLKPIVATARFTGLRQSNVVELTWNQVDLFRKVITVGKTKNGDPIGIPMTETVFLLFKELGKVRRLHSAYVFPNGQGKARDKAAVSRAFKKACRKAGIGDLRFHDLRHDFGSRLVQGGVDIYAVKELMEHKDIKMTMRYAHLSPEKLRRDIRVLDDEVPQKSRNFSTAEM